MAADDPVECALAAFQAGDLEGAERLSREGLRAEPDNPDLLNLVGVLALYAEAPARAADSLRKAVALRADEPQFRLNCATALIAIGALQEAASHLEQAASLAPEEAVAHGQLAAVRHALGDASGAVESMKQALALDPENAEYLSNLSAMLVEDGQHEEACGHAARAVELAPDLAEAHYNLSVALRELGSLEDAAASCREALGLSPDYAEAHNNLGCVLLSLEQEEAAIGSLQRATELSPSNEELCGNLARAFTAAKRTNEAQAAYRRGLACNPESETLCAALEYSLRQTCSWDDIEELRARLDDLTSRAIAEGRRAPETPHAFLTRSYDMKRALEIARSWSEHAAAAVKEQGLSVGHHEPTGSEERIRIGYLSNNFRNHALSHLMQRVFGLHDRGRYHISAYSYGGAVADDYTKRIAHDCDAFVDLSELDDAGAAQRINRDRVDILVDLRGHGSGARFAIAAQRIAPIQVQYLGFPGTTGSSAFDYFVGDATVCPPETKPYFSEALVIMPHCYQVNDDRQEIAQTIPKRSNFGLPHDAFVFSSFNGMYKLNPTLFAAWMEILTAVPKAVLWLFEGDPQAEANLKRMAKQAGVEPERLIFTSELPKPEHLARLGLADLAIDSFPCNGHTTTSDALWAGLPVLTLEGRHFASNVAPSILKAVGMPQLIAADVPAYVEQAVALARDSARLSALREELRRKRGNAPLFDTAGFVRDLERAYAEMWRRYLAKEPAAAIDLRTPA